MKQLVTLSFAIKNTKEEDIFKKLKTVFSDVSFTCQINNKNFEHDISIESENKEEFVIIHKKDLIELQKSKHVLKDLLGTIENLNNKLKQTCDDIRTISKS